MLRYAEDHQEVAYQYAHALVTFFTIDLDIPKALQLTRDIITESTNDIRNFEGEEVASQIDAALRWLIDRVEAQMADRAACHRTATQCDRPPRALCQPKPGGILTPTERPNQPGRKEKMSTVIYRTEDPALETVEFGAVYSIHAPSTGEPRVLHKIADKCNVSSLEPLDMPARWDDVYEYVMVDETIWPRIARLARDADLAHANLEVALVPVEDEETDADSYALLYRFIWPH